MKRRSLFQEKSLTEFLPMLPALRDAKDPGHVDAVEYLEDFERWPILRFIWAEKFKLSPKEAAIFVTTRSSERLTTLMLACLEKDQAKASEAFTKVVTSVKSSSEDIVFAACLYSRLQPLSGPHEEPDLKPPGAVSIRQAVLEKLHPGSRAAK